MGEIKEMTSTLLTFGIGRTAAAEYAAQLFEAGFPLHRISEKRMQKLGFKKKDIKLVLLGEMVKQLEQDRSDADLWFAVAVKNSLKVKINCVGQLGKCRRRHSGWKVLRRERVLRKKGGNRCAKKKIRHDMIILKELTSKNDFSQEVVS